MKTVRSTLFDAVHQDPHDKGDLFKIYPNPDHDRPLRFEGSITGNMTQCDVVVYDMQGRMVRDVVCRTAGSNLRGEIDTTGLPAGSYGLRVTSNGGI